MPFPASTAMAETWLLAFGFQAVVTPVARSISAARLRGTPPTVVKRPPA